MISLFILILLLRNKFIKMNLINYFGYASNLKQSLFEERINGKHPLNIWKGKLNNYQFCFNHKQSNGQTRANIIKKDGMNVLGIIYLIDQQSFDILIQSEPDYKIIDVDIEINSNKDIIKAKTFITDKTESNYLIPSDEYLKTILIGAQQHNLSQEYINYIISISNI